VVVGLQILAAVVSGIGGGRAADLDPVVVVTVEMRWSKCVGGERWECGGEVLVAFGSDVLRFDAISVC
jgi:hypothetical protein